MIRSILSNNIRILTGIFAGLLSLMLSGIGVFLPFERAVDNMLFLAAAHPANPDIAIVGFDAKTIELHGDKPSLRPVLSQVLERLAESGANRIVVDFPLARSTSPLNDAALEAALKRLGPERVALTSSIYLERLADGTLRHVRRVPLERFSAHASVVNGTFWPENDGRLRLAGGGAKDGSDFVSSAIWLSQTDPSLGSFRIDYGVDVFAFKTISASDLADGHIDAKTLEGKRVIIGVTRRAGGNEVLVSLHGQVPRPNVLAAATDTLMSDQMVQAMPSIAVATLVVVIGIFVVVWGARLRKPIVLSALVLGLIMVGFQITIVFNQSFAMEFPFVTLSMTSIFAALIALIHTHPSFHRLRRALLAWLAKVDIELANVIDASADAVITFSRDGRILSANERSQAIFNIPEAALVGKNINDLLSEDGSPLLGAFYSRAPGRLEALTRSEGANAKHLDISYNCIAGDGDLIGFASLRDITDRTQREDALKQLAYRDSLTEVANRTAFDSALEKATAQAAHNGTFAVMQIDLNDFKLVNDTHGHHVGDAVLVDVARRFSSAAAGHGMVARLGGDEFAVLMEPGSNANQAVYLADLLLAIVDEIDFIDGREVNIGASIGIAIYGEHTIDEEMLLRLADGAMYHAKQNGLGYNIAKGCQEEKVWTVA